MTIDKVHERINFIRDQEIGGYNTPAEIDNALDTASMWCFNDYRERYATDVTAYEALAPFKKKLDFITSGGGTLTVSSLVGYEEYAQLLNIQVAVVDADISAARKWDVTISTDDEMSSRQNSQLNPIAVTNPIAEELGVGVFQLYPETTHAGTIRYLKRPAKPVFGYTEAGREITYNSGSSTQLEWNDIFINKIIARALNILGVNLDNDKLVAYGLQWPKENI